MTFMTPEAYYQALLTAIPVANKRIIIHVMDIRWGGKHDTFIPLLKAAAQRGVRVQLIGDAYSRFQSKIPHLKRGHSQGWKTQVRTSDDLRKSGVEVTYIGKIGINPFAGRTHSKITIVDDEVFTFGGINFTADWFINSDFMLHMHDAILADRLDQLVQDIKSDAKILPDLEELLGEGATMLFDGGTPGKSIIYDTACTLIKNAAHVYFVSQMCPSGQLAQLLHKTDSSCYFISPRQTDFPANIGLILDQKRYRIRNLYKGTRYIHAKFILTVDKQGKKHLLCGSNNFSWRGISFGTKEIAVHSTDPRLWDEVYQYMQRSIVDVR